MEWWVWLAIALAVVLIIALIVIIIIASKKKNEEEGEEVPVQDEEPEQEKKSSTPEKKQAKPSNKVYHIAKRKSDGKWQVKAAGAEKALKLFDTQAEAIEFAKQVAGNQEAKIMIHKEDGSFRRLTYKN